MRLLVISVLHFLLLLDNMIPSIQYVYCFDVRCPLSLSCAVRRTLCSENFSEIGTRAAGSQEEIVNSGAASHLSELHRLFHLCHYPCRNDFYQQGSQDQDGVVRQL